MTLVYLSNYNTSVFNSQVIFLLNFLIRNFNFDKLFLLVGYSSDEEKNKIPVDLIDPEIEVIFYRRYPDYPILTWLNIRSIRKAVAPIQVKQLPKAVFHIRTEILGYYLLKALPPFKKPQKILIDVRGALYDEIETYYKNYFVKKLKILLLKRTHQYIRKSPVFLSCVSAELKNYLISKYGHHEEKIIINPCAYSDFFKFNLQKRIDIRRQLNVRDDDLIVVFSTGGESKWQNSDIIINHLANIKSIKVLNLSKGKYDGENIFNFYIPFIEVPDYLSSADVAIIIRENNVVNKVASPVKFSEYMACGLPVISNKGVSMIVEILSNNNAGKVINLIDQVDEKLIQEAASLDRRHIVKIAEQYFSIKNVSQSYYNFYNQDLK